MNLFLLHRKHKKNVLKYCNRHVVKMVLETAQLLYTAAHCGNAPLHKTGIKHYKKTHVWHPTSVWVRESRHNWEYTIRFAFTLSKHYTIRYNKVHKCHTHFIALRKLGYFPPKIIRPVKKKRGKVKEIKYGIIKNTKCTAFPCAMPDNCIVYKNDAVDVCKSYRKYYKQKNKEWKIKGRPMKFETKFYKLTQ
jgi:hypothetical protein